jgi:hypothetical protein
MLWRFLGTVDWPWAYRERAVGVPWAYLERNLSVPWAYRGCILSVPELYRELTVSVPWAYRGRTVSVPWTYRVEKCSVFLLVDESWSDCLRRPQQTIPLTNVCLVFQFEGAFSWKTMSILLSHWFINCPFIYIYIYIYKLWYSKEVAVAWQAARATHVLEPLCSYEEISKVRGTQILQISRSHLKILDARMLT